MIASFGFGASFFGDDYVGSVFTEVFGGSGAFGLSGGFEVCCAGVGTLFLSSAMNFPP